MLGLQAEHECEHIVTKQNKLALQREHGTSLTAGLRPND